MRKRTSGGDGHIAWPDDFSGMRGRELRSTGLTRVETLPGSSIVTGAKTMSAAKDCARNESRVDKVNFGDLPQLLGYQIRQVQTALFKDFSDSSADIRVTPGEFSLLTLIDTNPGVSQTALMSVYKVDKSTLSLSIRGLQKRGLVRRVRGQLVQRFQSLWLTEAGVQSLQRIRRQVDRQERAMDACLRSGERAQLLDMLTRIRRAFDQTSLDHRERGRKD